MSKQELVGKDGMDKLLPDFTEMETSIIVSVISGESTKVTSRKLRIPESFIRTFLNKPKVKAYIKEQKELAAELVQLKIQGLLVEILEERIDACDGEVSNLTNKDTLDVLKLLQDVSSGISKASQQAETEDKYAAILGLVLKDEK